jgi:hypothetical protein
MLNFTISMSHNSPSSGWREVCFDDVGSPGLVEESAMFNGSFSALRITFCNRICDPIGSWAYCLDFEVITHFLLLNTALNKVNRTYCEINKML